MRDVTGEGAQEKPKKNVDKREKEKEKSGKEPTNESVKERHRKLLDRYRSNPENFFHEGIEEGGRRFSAWGRHPPARDEPPCFILLEHVFAFDQAEPAEVQSVYMPTLNVKTNTCEGILALCECLLVHAHA